MAEISREELLAAKQKESPKKVHLTLQEKYDICCLAEESPLSNYDFAEEWTQSTGKQKGQVLDQIKLARWKAKVGPEEWRECLEMAPEKEAAFRKIPNWWRSLLNAEFLSAGGSPKELPFPASLGCPKYTDKFEIVREICEEVVALAKERIKLRESVKWKNIQATLNAMIMEENAHRRLAGGPELPCKGSVGWASGVVSGADLSSARVTSLETKVLDESSEEMISFRRQRQELEDEICEQLVGTAREWYYVNQWDQLFACLKSRQLKEICEMKGLSADLRERPKPDEIPRTAAGNRKSITQEDFAASVCKVIENFPTKFLACAAVQVQMMSEADHHAILGISAEAATATRNELKEIIDDSVRKGLHTARYSALAGRKRKAPEISEDAPIEG